MSPSTIYFITGASRGIGLALVRELSHRASSSSSADKITVLAGVRNPAAAPLLAEIVARYPGIVDVVSYVAADVENNATLARYIGEKYGRVDVVVPNAGIANYFGRVTETPITEMRAHWEVNALGPLILFQALLPLLRASPNPKFIPITSGAGSSLYYDAQMEQAAYGSSKAVLNFVTKKIHVENEWITAFPLAPGVVDTDMARQAVASDNTGAMTKLLEELGVSQEEAGRLLVDIIDAAKRETHGGQFVNIDGTQLPW